MNWLHRQVTARPHALAVQTTEQSLTWSALGTRVRRVAAALRGVGVQQNDRVAVLIVDPAQLVDVEDDHREGLAAATRAGQLDDPAVTVLGSDDNGWIRMSLDVAALAAGSDASTFDRIVFKDVSGAGLFRLRRQGLVLSPTCALLCQ